MAWAEVNTTLLAPLPTDTISRDLKAQVSPSNTGEDSTHGHHQMLSTEIRLIIFFAAKDGEALYSQQKHDCGSDHELLIAKFRLTLKKVGKTT